MGNTTSVEELGRGRRSAHKLSKPRTANHENNTLLSPIGLSDPRRRYSTARTTSLPYGTSPISSPLWSPPVKSSMEIPPTDDEIQPEAKSRTRSITRTATALFRSRSSQAVHGGRSRQDSIGTQTPSQSARPSRANSMIIGPSESSYTQFNPATWQTAGSRSSVTYDMNSYEAKRLLNLVEEPAYESNSIVSESQFQVAELARKNSVLSPSPEKISPTKPLPRANSDISLYAPMRRRSMLVTPGVATRAPDVPAIPRKTKARFSLPSTPARRDSLESMGLGIISIPPPTVDLESMPRVSTPSDEDYGHIGAFKLGTLRIINGSPAMSPTVDPTPPPPNVALPPFLKESEESSYFGQRQSGKHAKVFSANSTGAELTASRSNATKPRLQPIVTASQAGSLETRSPASPSFPQYLPEMRMSSLVVRNHHETSTFELQTTSKHSALEDDLFDDDQGEIAQPEVLNVRVDLSAKSLPPRPRLVSEGRNPREMMRSDSGVAATPISEHPVGSLAKSDSGYSSNISLRSFSAKPPVPGKSQSGSSQPESEPRTPAKDTFPAQVRLLVDTSVTRTSAEGMSRPPVPSKNSPVDMASMSKNSSPDDARASGSSGEGFFTEQHSPRFGLDHSQELAKTVPASSNLSPQSPTSSSSFSSSAGKDTRKPGKLERLLSSARKPLTAHMTQPSEKASAASVSMAAEQHDKEQSGPFSLSLKRLTLKTTSSRATLGTIISVSSTEAQDDDVPPVPSLPKIIPTANEDREKPYSSQNAHVSKASPASPTATSMRKAVPRKPVPIRKDSMEINMMRAKATHTGEGANPKSKVLDNTTRNTLAATSEKPDTDTSLFTEPDLQLSQFGELGFAASIEKALSSMPTSYNSELGSKARSSPPISMNTRNRGPARTAPAPRAKSTPPVVKRNDKAPPMPRRSSRENIFNNLPNQPALLRRSSRENVHSYPPAQAQYNSLDHQTILSAAPTTRRGSLNNNDGLGDYRTPNWEVQTDHAEMRRPSIDQPRQASQQSQDDFSRSLQQPETQKSARPSVLRQRSSYDSFTYRQVQEAAKNFSQGSRGSPHVTRAHSRNHSLGSHGHTAPYRVLHSYNSPAYRNAPIWG